MNDQFQDKQQAEQAYIGAQQAKMWRPDDVEVEKIAQICHEANRAICVVNGDLTQPSWEGAPDWQRNSAKDGVVFHINNPYADPRDSHDRWMEVKLRDGWRYGEVKDADSKTHPCLLPHKSLPEKDRIKDDVFRSIVRAYVEGLAKIRMGNSANLAGGAIGRTVPSQA